MAVAIGLVGLGVTLREMSSRLWSGVAITYACPEPVAAADRDVMLARFPPQMPGTVEALDSSHLRVRVADDPVALRFAHELTRAGHLDLRVVDETAMETVAAGALPAGVRVVGREHVRLTADDAQTLAAIVPPPGLTLLTQCGTHCDAWIVGPSVAGELAVHDATTTIDDEGAVTLRIMLTLSTGYHLTHEAIDPRGRRFVVVLDGAPYRAHYADGHGDLIVAFSSDADDYVVAESIARALPITGLACSRWSLVSESPF